MSLCIYKKADKLKGKDTLVNFKKKRNKGM